MLPPGGDERPGKARNRACPFWARHAALGPAERRVRSAQAARRQRATQESGHIAASFPVRRGDGSVSQDAGAEAVLLEP